MTATSAPASTVRRRALVHAAPALLLLAGCAGLSWQPPVRVQVVGLQPLDGEALELRFLCVLRVQNPNEAPFPFRGVSLELQVRGAHFAAGVSDASGTVPPFGEAVVSVPVSASAMDLARIVMGLIADDDAPRLEYVVRGRIGSAGFETRGELGFPTPPQST